jgi:hypothetical protein
MDSYNKFYSPTMCYNELKLTQRLFKFDEEIFGDYFCTQPTQTADITDSDDDDGWNDVLDILAEVENLRHEILSEVEEIHGDVPAKSR